MFQKIFNTKGAKMRWGIKLLALGMILCIAQLGMVSPADAGQRSKQAKKMERKKQKEENRLEKRRKDRRIVMFADWVDEGERQAYLKEMKKRKIKLVKEMPFINGAVLRVPRSISNDELADDERVASAVTNHGTRLKKGRKDERLRLRDTENGAELVYISGDGLSGDGGSGDGGSGDGGSGDGGSGDGGSTVNPMFRIVDPLGDAEKPWGILDLYDHPYDPEWLTWKMDPDQLPESIQSALNMIQELLGAIGIELDLTGMTDNATAKTKVAILDTGVNYTHPDLAGAILGGADIVGGTVGIPMDNHGHGTHVAGTIASQHAGGAPGEVDLYAVKILNDDGSGEVATLLMGMEWAIKNQMDIISMSVAYATDNDAVRQAVEMAHKSGIIMVAATGNHSNWEDDDISSGDGGSGDGGSGDGGSGDGGSLAYDATAGLYPVMYPAAYPEVIAVSAMDTWEQEAEFSNSGPEVDVLAPGVDVISTVGADGYALCNGSSMAAPHVTAAVVLLKAEADKNNVVLSPDDVKALLSRSVNTNGAIDLDNALEIFSSKFASEVDVDPVKITPIYTITPTVALY